MSENTAEARREAVRAEYSKYVAAEVITINGVRAFNPGDAVPIGQVEGFSRPEIDDTGQPTGKTEKIAPTVSKDQVVGSNTKAATAAKES